MARVGIQVAGTTAPGEVAAVAEEVERLGYAELWLAEDYFDLGGIASTATALAATREIGVGLGVVSVRVRHPAVTAMEFATLAGAFTGRFMAGIGHGVPSWTGQMGLQPASLLRSLGDGSRAVRRLLDGEELTEEGEYATFHEVRLRFLSALIDSVPDIAAAVNELLSGDGLPAVSVDAVRGMPDLNARELLAIGPVIALVILLGFYPKPALDVINPTTDVLMEQVGATDPEPAVPAAEGGTP